MIKEILKRIPFFIVIVVTSCGRSNVGVDPMTVMDAEAYLSCEFVNGLEYGLSSDQHRYTSDFSNNTIHVSFIDDDKKVTEIVLLFGMDEINKGVRNQKYRGYIQPKDEGGIFMSGVKIISYKRDGKDAIIAGLFDKKNSYAHKEGDLIRGEFRFVINNCFESEEY